MDVGPEPKHLSEIEEDSAYPSPSNKDSLIIIKTNDNSDNKTRFHIVSPVTRDYL